MAKTDFSTWDQNADSNTDIAGINIAEGCPAAGINNAIRAVMAQLAAAGLVRAGVSAVNDLLGAIVKKLSNASTIYDNATVERGIGYRALPMRQVTAASTIAANDMGGGIASTTGGLTIPANATVPIAVGDGGVVFLNRSASNQTITPASGVTLRLSGTASVGTRTVVAYSIATLVKVDTDEWWLSGSGVY